VTSRPDCAAADKDRGDELRELGRFEEALACYRRALEVQGAQDSVLLAGLFASCGDVLLAMRRSEEAAAYYDRSVAIKADDVRVLNNYGVALMRAGRLEAALLSLNIAIRRAPGFSEAHNNRGAAYLRLLRYPEALQCFDAALRSSPDYREAVLNRGVALEAMERNAEAAEAFARLLSLDPKAPFGSGRRFLAQRRCCDWRDYDLQREQVVTAVNRAEAADLPFPFLSVSDETGAQLQCARTYVTRELEQVGATRPGPYGHRRPRVAYLSRDFRDHAVAYLMAGVLEKHDKRSFDTYAISLRPPDTGRYGQRMAQAVGQFVDISAMSDAQAAARIRSLEVDILIDLAGFTQGARTGILAHRPAPIQVNYLGFPGTLGAPFVDYLIADRHLIPERLQSGYAEQIVYLPECFQANDDQRPVVRGTPSRTELGLPENALVLCCFNNSYKINPPLFSVWMRLLQGFPDSVVWLVSNSEVVRQNLCREAHLRAVDPARLVFASPMPYEEHLARLSQSDLFLDTFPFNGGTSVSDALWAGLPVLTCDGEALASRMAGSLLSAVDLKELIARDLAQYEHLAVSLLSNRQCLIELRARLREQRSFSPLFNTTRFTRHLESAYATMHRACEQGLPPRHFAVAALDQADL